MFRGWKKVAPVSWVGRFSGSDLALREQKKRINKTNLGGLFVVKYSKKVNPALVLCSSFLLLSLTGCGGSSGFANGPKAAVDTPLVGDKDTPNSDSDTGSDIDSDPGSDTSAGITFNPSSGAQLQVNQDSVAIRGLENYMAVCISEGELHPVFAGEVCVDGLQFNALPSELLLPLGCKADSPEMQSHALKISALTQSFEVVFADVNFTQACNQSPDTDTPGDEPPTPDEPPVITRESCRINTRTPTNSVSWNYEQIVEIPADFGRVLTATNDAFFLVYQGDGNLVLRDEETRTSQWSSGTADRGENGTLKLESDGNLAIYAASGLGLWDSGIGGSASEYLMVTDIGAVIIVQNDEIIWSEGTPLEACDEFPPASAPDSDPSTDPDPSTGSDPSTDLPSGNMPEPEPDRLVAALVMSKPDFTTREEVSVSYSIGFSGQYTPTGEHLSVFPAGAIAPDCTIKDSSLMDMPVMVSSGTVALPSQLQLGSYQLQMRDQNGCHIGAPATFNIVEPEVLVTRLVNGLNGYSGTQDTTITEFGPWHTIPLGGDHDNWVFTRTGDEGELIVLLKWDIPSNISGLIQQVSLQLDVINPSNEGFTIHAMNAPWSENRAIWDNVNLAANQGRTVLGTIRPRQLGLSSTQLNASGRALVQSWIDGDVPNYGFVIRASNNGVDGFTFQSSEEVRIAQRPTMQINYVE